MSADAFPSPEREPQPNKVDDYLHQLFSYDEEVDPEATTAAVVINDPELQDRLNKKMEAGMSLSFALYMLEGEDPSGSVHEAHQKEKEINHLLLQPAMECTGIGFDPRGTDRELSILNLHTFAQAVKAARLPTDPEHQKLMTAGFDRLIVDVLFRLATAEIGSTTDEVIDAMYEGDRPEWASGSEVREPDALTFSIRRQIAQYIPEITQELSRFDVDAESICHLLLFEKAEQEGLTLHWALMLYGAAFDSTRFAGGADRQEIEQIFNLIDNAKLTSGQNSEFLRGVRTLLLSAIKHETQLIAEDQLGPDNRMDDITEGWHEYRTALLAQCATIIDAMIPETEG